MSFLTIILIQLYTVKTKHDLLTQNHVELNIRSIIQQSGETINYHNHINPWDLENSPEISCLYCVSETPEPSHVIFKYDDGRNKHRRWKVPMKKGTFILYSSSLPFSITKNDNKDFLINLSLHFQLL